MKRSMVIVIHFNTVVKRSEQQDALDERVDRLSRRCVMKYTCRSFLAQTNQNFLALIFYADADKALCEAVLARHPKLPDHIRFIPFSNYRKHIYDYIRGTDGLYLTTMGSDDMYHTTMIEQLYAASPRLKRK